MAEDTTKKEIPAPVVAVLPPAPASNAGRPTDYDPIRTVERTLAYIESPRAVSGKLKFPSIAGLAVYLKIARSTIYEWTKIYPEFSDIIERLLAEQEAALLENGLDGTFNATIVKVVLTKHGYKDQADLTTNNKDITPDNQSAANAAIVSFLTKKPDGPATNPTIQPKGKDTPAV